MVSASFLFGVILCTSFVSLSCSLSASRKIEARNNFVALEPSPPIFQKVFLDVAPIVAEAKDTSGRKMKVEKTVMIAKETISRRSTTNAAPKLEMDFTSDYHVPKPHPPKNN